MLSIVPALGILLTAICIYLFVGGLSGMFSVPWLPIVRPELGKSNTGLPESLKSKAGGYRQKNSKAGIV